MDFIKIFPETAQHFLLGIGLIVATYFIWKFNSNKAANEAIHNYKTLAESQEKVNEQLRCEMAEIKKEFEKQLSAIRAEKRELEAQVNRLQGENEALKKLLTYQDPGFRDTVKSILMEIKKLREDFEGHSQQDNTRFGEIFGALKELKDGELKTLTN
jgi:DNA repair exonuclease SbcCD ATPase subunit